MYQQYNLSTRLLVVFLLNTLAFGFQLYPAKTASVSSTGLLQPTITPVVLKQSGNDVEYIDDEEQEETGPPVPPDMKYLPRNVMRQHKNFVAIRQAGGKELTNDVYIREPNHSDVFWFVGKVARVSDVTVAQAVSRQWALIEMHGSNLRPIELFPGRGSLEIWTAPGDSEMQVAYNVPDLVFTKMERDVEGAKGIKNALVGFQGEVYQGREEGFRTWRNNDGRAARPPVQSPNQDELKTPTDEDMKKIEEMLEGQDLNELYKEQQRRAGKPVDD